jgi:hypothetical protein
MANLLRCIALVVSMSGCLPDRPDPSNDHGGDPGGGSGGGTGSNGSGSGSSRPPPSKRGRQTMSDVHVQPGSEQVWMVHSAVADTTATPMVTTAHFGVYLPDSNEFFDVIDTTGSLGKKILFSSSDRVLYVTGRGTSQDVFVTVDTVARRPLNQRSYPGDRSDFRLSPSGRMLISANRTDSALHILDTTSLVDRPMPGVSSDDEVLWASSEDVLYVVQADYTSTPILRFDLRAVDLGKPLAPPAVVATIPGAGLLPVLSPSERYLALTVLPDSGGLQAAMIDLTTGTSHLLATVSIANFTADSRVIVWQDQADHTYDLHLVDPATGDAGPAAVTGWKSPGSLPLRHHDLVIISPPSSTELGFLYHLTDGTRTATPGLTSVDSMFERPGHAELWTWDEHAATLRWLDLTAGGRLDLVANVDSVDYRTIADDVVVGTFDHSVFRMSMATRDLIGHPLVLADPNDVTAPYRLAEP